MNALLILGSLLALASAAPDKERLRVDLQDLFHSGGLTIVNRQVTVSSDSSRPGIVLSEEYGEGVVWINGVTFTSGTIDIELKGQDIYQHSFIGIAFRGTNDSTFDAVYFRPFHFLSDDPVRKGRCVQYISLPAFPWRRLRDEHPGMYEGSVSPAPDPNDWFHAKIVVRGDSVAVFVNGADTPSLRVQTVGDRKGGMIGLYTADRSGGAFRALEIEPE
jgi:hypothetical protein